MRRTKPKTPPAARAEAVRLHQAGDLAAAERLYRKLLDRDGGDADLHYLFGVLRFQQGRDAEALAALARAVRSDPGHAAAWALSALAAQRLGRPADALAAYDRALALRPDHWEAHSNRAVLLAEMGRPAEALAGAERALALNPGLAEAHNNRGNALRDLCRREEALAAYDAALALAPDLAAAHDNRGRLLVDLGRPAEAIRSYARALALAPGHRDARRGLAAALATRDDPLAILTGLQALADADAADLAIGVADGLARRDRPAAALAAFDQALARAPGHLDAMNRKAVLLAEIGRLTESVGLLAEAIAAAPAEPLLYYNYGLFSRFEAGHPYLDAMAALDRDDTGLGEEQRVYLHFARAKAADDVGDPDGAIRHLVAGNALQRSRIRYDAAEPEALLDRIRRICSRDVIAGGATSGESSARPVFIVGMPRSGSTLIEQALAAHSQVWGAGETDAFRSVLAAFGAEGGLTYPERVAELSADDLRRLADAYLARAAPPSAEVARVTDKTLINLWHVGLIHKVLPRARFVHVVRDPVDTCFSCFSQLFNTPMPYAYDLGELGRHHRAASAAMAHWRSVLPDDTMIEVRYEEVVADPEGQIRRLLAHCGLAWEPGCAETHLVRRTVRTASIAQVRRPISTASVGRSRPYEAFLAPLLEALRAPPTPPAGCTDGAQIVRPPSTSSTTPVTNAASSEAR